MSLKPWFDAVKPRADLRDGRPLDAAEFAVNLEDIRVGRAEQEYQNPDLFFQRNYMTESMMETAGQVLQRLSGERVGVNAVYDLNTQFGGGKTHTLALLYHLANEGLSANRWSGVSPLLRHAGLREVPKAQTAVFVGHEFDSVSHRGEDGEPKRRSPWGEIAYQLGGAECFELLQEHDEEMIAPGGDVIRRMLPDAPCLILMDEVLGWISRYRERGWGNQMYEFVHNLSEVARGETGVVLMTAIPISEGEMMPEDRADWSRLNKLLERLGKSVLLSAEHEMVEIIKRRLFEWDGLPAEGRETAGEYAHWVRKYRQQIPQWFPIDRAQEHFESYYPFHPMAVSVFERKWRALPTFQLTRGALRLLALWVSQAYQDGLQGDHKDLLIGLGTAPLGDTTFRTDVLEQLDNQEMEGPVTADIVGRSDSHAVRLDEEAVDTVREARLHQKVATAVFFESNGGQTKDKAVASEAEIHLAVSEIDLDIGHVDTVLDTLTNECYFLTVEGKRYYFDTKPNLNKLFADRTVSEERIDEKVKREISTAFSSRTSFSLSMFPSDSMGVSNRPGLHLAVVGPDHTLRDSESTREFIKSLVLQYGQGRRAFKNGVICAVMSDDAAAREAARNLLAWEDIADEAHQLGLDQNQQSYVRQQVSRAASALKEAVWGAYCHVMLLDNDEGIAEVNLGMVNSSAASNLTELISRRLEQDDTVVHSLSIDYLLRSWPPALEEWSTKEVRDAVYKSPKFPRLLDPDTLKETIARGVRDGRVAYASRTADGDFDPVYFAEDLSAVDVAFDEDMFIMRKDRALEIMGTDTGEEVEEGHEADIAPTIDEAEEESSTPTGTERPAIQAIKWTGEVPSQKWMTFYTQVLTPFVTQGGLSLRVTAHIEPSNGVTQRQVDEMRSKLRDLGLDDTVEE